MTQHFTLFLDRDGVINRRLPGAYVRRWEEFDFLPGVPEALAVLAGIFRYVIVVTNQQGIGKGLMTEADLEVIHRQMREAVAAGGGRIDGIYHCGALRSAPNNCRKPAPVMALQAQADFPEINFDRSVMVGDSVSDMKFGLGLGMQVVRITGKEEEDQDFLELLPSITATYPSLAAFAEAWIQRIEP